MKKHLALGLVLILALGVFAGCTKEEIQSPDTTKPTETSEKSPEETVEISVMLFDRGNIPDGQGTIDDNRWTQYLNEQMAPKGILIDFMPIPRSEEAQKIPVLMSSGTAADIMMTYDYALVEKFYNDGGLHELSEYISENQVPDLIEYIGQETIDAGKNVVGEQYAIPARRAIRTITNQMIRKDWLDTLDLKVPTTIDEFYIILKAFKEQDPGNVGSDKVIPFNGESDNLNYAFLENLSETETLINHSTELKVYTDKGYREFMRFKNKLYNEDLMDPEYFTAEDFGQRRNEFFVSGVAGWMAGNTNYNVDTLRGGLLQNLKKNIPEAEFVSMLPITNVHDGKVYNKAYAPTGAFNFIPKTAKHPEACVEYLNLLAGEAGHMIFHGVEGEHFEYEDGVEVVIDAEYNAETKDWIRHDLFLVGNQGYYKTEEDFIAATAKELPGWEQYVTDNYNLALEGTVISNSIFNSPTEVEQSGSIGKINSDYSVKVVTCKPDEFDGFYDEWIKELEKYDIEKIIQERTEYYDSMMD